MNLDRLSWCAFMGVAVGAMLGTIALVTFLLMT